jgi:flavorubredoxin
MRNFHIRCGLDAGIIKNSYLVADELLDPSNEHNFAILCLEHEREAI